MGPDQPPRPSPPPAIRCLRCGRIHRRWTVLARCLFGLIYAIGDGPVAVMCWCRGHRHVTAALYPDATRANAVKARIDRTGCTVGGCRRRHRVVYLSAAAWPAVAEPAEVLGVGRPTT